MARMARLVVPNYPHHVTQRGNRRQQTFFSNADYEYYLELLAHYTRQAQTEIWAYCLMPNHIHLVMVPRDVDGLRKALSETHRRYTRSINFRNGWRGHLWQERFHSFLMDEQRLLATVRYVERNPVAAKLCNSPQDWKWSSARAHIEGKDDQLVKVKPMLNYINDWESYLLPSQNDDERELIRLHSRTGRPLGSLDFVQRLMKATGRCDLLPRKPGPKQVGGS